MTHPSAIDLEAFACGDPVDRVAAHLDVDACGACRAFVERARGVARETPRVLLPPILAEARRRERSRRVVVVASVVAPVAIAATVLLWMGTHEPPRPSASATNVSAAPATVAALEPTTDPDTTFKGGRQLAVIRERGGAQERFTGAVRVRPSDRLRIEVALDRTQVILGAVLGDDGSYIEIMSGGVRDAGTHFSEKSTRIDEHPLRGTILVGAPAAVRLARTTGKLDGLTTLRVEWGAE